MDFVEIRGEVLKEKDDDNDNYDTNSMTKKNEITTRTGVILHLCYNKNLINQMSLGSRHIYCRSINLSS